jgi:hypothetical protein
MVNILKNPKKSIQEYHDLLLGLYKVIEDRISDDSRCVISDRNVTLDAKYIKDMITPFVTETLEDRIRELEEENLELKRELNKLYPKY